jgi:ketosteroid isomerase-like protein
MRLHLTIVTLGLTAITAPGEARNVGSSDAPIIALVQAFSDARSHFDPKALDALLTPDYVEVSPRGEIDRRQAVLGFYAADKATPVPPMSLATQDVRRYGDTAIVIGSVDYTIPTPTGAVKRTVRVTYVERRVGTRWLMASAQYRRAAGETGAIALSFPKIASENENGSAFS